MTSSVTKVTLRPAEPKDAPFTFGITQNKEYQKYYLERLISRNLNEEVGMIQRCAKSDSKKPKHYFVIELNKKPVGVLDIYKLSYEDKRGDIGYGIAKECWGQGVATKALKLGLKFMKDELKLHAAEATTDPKNIASCKVLEKNGFKEVGTIKDYYVDRGRYVDRTLYWKLL